MNLASLAADRTVLDQAAETKAHTFVDALRSNITRRAEERKTIVIAHGEEYEPERQDQPQHRTTPIRVRRLCLRVILLSLSDRYSRSIPTSRATESTASIGRLVTGETPGGPNRAAPVRHALPAPAPHRTAPGAPILPRYHPGMQAVPEGSDTMPAIAPAPSPELFGPRNDGTPLRGGGGGSIGDTPTHHLDPGRIRRRIGQKRTILRERPVLVAVSCWAAVARKEGAPSAISRIDIQGLPRKPRRAEEMNPTPSEAMTSAFAEIRQTARHPATEAG